MDITLVTSSFDKLVHGTENEKKTGCGINLLKPENVTRFHRTSQMTDLKEITCEKCKANLAKKLIKADKKEMALLLKEEKKREKLGMNDAGIVPLGNTTARITRDPDAKRKEEEARRKALEEQKKAAEEKRAAEAAAKEAEDQKLYDQFLNKDAKTVPGTGVPMDESLAQFAINAPNNGAQAPAPTAAPAAEDDFLAQFAINKPGDTAAPAPAAAAPQQDDFLAQFAIPAPEQTQNTDTAPYYNVPQQPVGGYNAPQQPVGGFGYEQPVIPEPAPMTAPDPSHSDEDIMNLFSINNSAAVQEEPVYGQPIIYDGSQPLYDAQGNLIQGIITPVDEYADAPIMNIPQDTAWDYVADQFFGGDAAVQGNAAAVQDGYENVQPGEMADLDIPTIGNISAPVIDDIGAAIDAASKPYGGVPGGLNAHVPDEMAAPVSGQTIDPNTAYMYGDIPLVEDIVAPENDVLPSAASVAAEALSGAPTVDDITAPEFGELPSASQLAAEALSGAPTVDDITAPEFDELPSAAQLAAEALSGAPTVDDITAPELDELPTIDDIAAQGHDNMQIPVLDDINAPIYNAPYMAEEEFEFNMSDYNNFDANAQNTGAGQPNQAQPQIVKVPQFAGYDANNQPVYKYVPMRLMGYDQNGKPVFAPLNAQPQQAAQPHQAAPAQQTAAQAQRAAAAPAPAQAPVQQAPVRSVVPKKPVQTEGVPTANISKIAVNPHEKSTSQAFINAISSSREYADKNLIETQGLHANSPILNSVEDVLSTMGDDSAKQRQLAQNQQNVPVFDEYKAPASSSYNRRNNASPRLQQSYDKDVRYMTKSELKAKKKQDKIDAKFRKEMNKRGF
ncbi:hypothetical protein [Ruminococcus sp.]|uniref:hypothetical protein n=1 Tax=Ruminococcus sp. TaxID=41978 RepID=UPI0025F7099B|nr:hypothetical protein [Ruminococcus sp.]MCR4638460.1 hypothetical protein [Ruminococcus sp.]